MEPTQSNRRRIAFDRFEADLSSGELLKNGRRLGLQAQPFRLLTLLLEHAGAVVTREEIRDKLWPADTFVDFDHSLSTAMNKIREALGDYAATPGLSLHRPDKQQERGRTARQRCSGGGCKCRRSSKDRNSASRQNTIHFARPKTGCALRAGIDHPARGAGDCVICGQAGRRARHG